MNAGSLFSGIGGLDHGLHNAGIRHAFFCESDEWRRGVLAHHWPGVPIYDDVRDVAGGSHARADERGPRREQGRNGTGGAVDLLCGGFPCQDLSVAGQRKGLAGERSGLFHEYARIAGALRPRWLLVENVPGLLSSNGGRDFGIVLGTLADLGYGLAWRIVDSRYFGVPQRRRRVFIIGALADGDPRAAAGRASQVLAVGTRCPRHPAAGGEARQDVAVASLSGLGTGGSDDNDGQGGRLVVPPLMFGHSRGGSNSLRPGFTGDGHIVATDGAGLASRRSETDGHRVAPSVSAPLSHGSNPNSNMAGRRREDDVNLVAAFSEKQRAEVLETDIARQLTSGGGKPRQGYSAVRQGASVRRLTPTECERLQALPDGWTDHGADSRRYAALGDAVTATVGEWIGRRIIEADTA